LQNLGAGSIKLPGWVSVDAYGNPDVTWDLNVTPFPWDDDSVDAILMSHILEHVDEWWACFKECARILKPGGTLKIHVPDESSRTALTYRDHLHVFSPASFHGTVGAGSGSNAWARTEEGSVPLLMQEYIRVPYKEYNWMTRFPRLLEFCANHMRGFIWEQQFHFVKVGTAKVVEAKRA
jgi:ubiquinone/menaquinone biosynthesis C-methylase UbiE